VSQLALVGIGKSFGDVEVLRDVDLEVADGELVVFVGPSGCGKSTLLRLIAGLDRPSRGDVLLDGKRVNEVPAADRGLAMVFQSYALYPHMTVRQNLAFGLENTKLPRSEIEERIADAARMLDIGNLLGRRPGQLSGGQRQRVAIGRAIVRRPGIFLLDEPLSNLDAELRVIMRAELAALQTRLSATMIYVTHDQVEAMTLADRIVVLRSGIVEQVGSPLDLYNRPANRFVAGFIGSPHMNFLPARVAGRRDGVVDVALDAGCRVAIPADPTGIEDGAALQVGIRPQHLSLAASGGIEAEVTLVEQLGSDTVVHVAPPAHPKLLAALPGQRPVRVGERVCLVAEPGSIHLFDATGRRVRSP
jgi:multiple sugar transport system ATP-binding protein